MMTLADVAVRSAVIARISRVQPESKPLWGRMSAPQMVCHLNDSFLTTLGEKEVSMRSGLFQRTMMKWVALYGPAPWPKGIRTLPEVEQGVGGTCPTEFTLDRSTLVRTIERFCRPDPALGRHPHPLFGLMSVRELLRWGYLHSDHHLRQFGV